MSRLPIERYQWPLGAGLVLLVGSALISERKRPARRKAGAAALAVAVLWWGLPPQVQAKNSGVEAYERKDYKGAMEEFGRQLQRRRDSEALHFNLGAAAYKSGDFGKALEEFARAVTSTDPQLRSAAEYNLGNTLFQRGAAAAEKEKKSSEWKDALQHYEQALKVDPQNGNAEHNRDVVRQLLAELEQQPPPEQQQQQQQQKANKDEQKKNQNQDQQQQQQQQQQQSQDGQKDKDQQQSQQQESQKDQQSKDSQSQQMQNQSKDDSQPGKDQEQKQQDKDDGKEKSAPQEKSGKEDEKKDSKDNPAGEGGKPEQPAVPADQPDKKRSGEIQAKNNPAQSDPQEEAAAEAQAAEEGKMTEAQARALLESLKGEDGRVQLLKPGERRPLRPARDW